jgi:hypothetical protein
MKHGLNITANLTLSFLLQMSQPAAPINIVVVVVIMASFAPTIIFDRGGMVTIPNFLHLALAIPVGF